MNLILIGILDKVGIKLAIFLGDKFKLTLYRHCLPNLVVQTTTSKCMYKKTYNLFTLDNERCSKLAKIGKFHDFCVFSDFKTTSYSSITGNIFKFDMKHSLRHNLHPWQ